MIKGWCFPCYNPCLYSSALQAALCICTFTEIPLRDGAKRKDGDGGDSGPGKAWRRNTGINETRGQIPSGLSPSLTVGSCPKPTGGAEQPHAQQGPAVRRGLAAEAVAEPGAELTSPGSPASPRPTGPFFPLHSASLAPVSTSVIGDTHTLVGSVTAMPINK